MANTNPVKRMKELIALIKEADTAYFKNDSPKLSDREYDLLVNELKDLEAASGLVFADSPSKRVSGETKKTLTTVLHTKPMLSANKTKSVAEVANFIGTQEALLSWKLDGLTLVLRYKNGILEKAITRGNGSEGEDVTHTVKYFRNVPSKIPYRDYLEVRGEGVLSWADFEMLGKSMASGESHPRNLAAGIVRTSNADRGKCSHLDFIAFAIISDTEYTKKIDQLAFLSGLGFDVVPHKFVPCVRNQEEFQEVVDSFVPDAYGYPVDGLVAEYNDIEFGKSLGATAHHENKLIALKWQDELTETIFRGVELITTRTGTVSIVGLFDTVVIDGARIHRASLHNLSVFEKYKFGIGDKISVYKANMIIPQIAENKTQSGTFVLPKFCPCCGETLTVKYSMSGVKDLYCPNTECIARNAQKIARFCDKKAMNIEGLSAVSLEKLMAFGWIKNFYDLYHLDEYRESIANTPGFGISSFEKMWNAINASRKTSLGKFLLGVGIPLLGPQAAKILDTYYYGSWDMFEEALQHNYAFSHIEGISPLLEKNIYKWYKNEAEEKLWRPVLNEVKFNERKHRSSGDKFSSFTDMNVVVTGTITGMTREKINEVLTLLGAIVSNSVSKNTDYLIVGAAPGGKKLSAAIKNGTKIITESQFLTMLEN